MKLIEVQKAVSNLVGVKVQRPSRTLAGHAAGLPFEDLVHEKLEKTFGNKVKRHYEFLNFILGNLKTDDADLRIKAFGPESLQSLICRGKKPMQNWSSENLFSEKQNDTAESVIVEDSRFIPESSSLTLIDVKTYNASKKGQPPNIISAGKLAKALALALEEGTVRFDFVYIGVMWMEQNNKLVADNVSVISLFKIPPSEIYINWAAAEQIQFHPHTIGQSFKGTKEEWARGFLIQFVASLEKRLSKQTLRLKHYKSLI